MVKRPNMVLKVTVVLVLSLMCMPSMEARTIPHGQDKLLEAVKQGEAPPHLPNIPAVTGDIPSPKITQKALFVTIDDHIDASPLLRRLLKAPPVSSSANPPTYIPPPKNQHASPSLGSKQKSTQSSSMTMPKGSTSIP